MVNKGQRKPQDYKDTAKGKPVEKAARGAAANPEPKLREVDEQTAGTNSLADDLAAKRQTFYKLLHKIVATVKDPNGGFSKSNAKVLLGKFKASYEPFNVDVRMWEETVNDYKQRAVGGTDTSLPQIHIDAIHMIRDMVGECIENAEDPSVPDAEDASTPDVEGLSETDAEGLS